jgi:hypothetical protein
VGRRVARPAALVRRSARLGGGGRRPVSGATAGVQFASETGDLSLEPGASVDACMQPTHSCFAS